MKNINDKAVLEARLKWARNTLKMYVDEELLDIMAQLNMTCDEIWAFEGARESLRALGKSDNEIERLFTALQLLHRYDDLPVTN